MDKAELKKKTVAELKEMAKKLPDAKGLSSLKKDDLVELLAGSESAPEQPKESAKSGKKAASPVETPGVKAPAVLDKAELKKRIRALKEEKRDAISRQDRAKSRECNRQIHYYKRRLRKMTRVVAKKK